LDLEGPSFSGGVTVEPGSFSGKKQEACKRWNNGKCFKPSLEVCPYIYALFAMGLTRRLIVKGSREGDLDTKMIC